MTLADHARRYAELGWALVPLEGKMPQGQGWQNSIPLDPLSTGNIWAEREKRWVDLNMGLVLGPSGVIDFELDDPRKQGLYWELVGDVQTPHYASGSGKPHMLFKDPGGLSRRTREGMELRAGPHQSVLPPSIHPETGNAYRWAPNFSPWDIPLADPPKGLLDFFSEANKAQGDFSGWREALGQKLGEGEGRHASMISYLGMAVNHFQTPDQLVAAAIAYASVTQDPPYPDDVIEQQALDVWHRYREEATPEEAKEYLHIERADRIRIKNVEFLWEPFIQKSALHLLVGRKGVGKGTMLAWLAAEVTKGGGFGPARSVLWVSGEDSFEQDVLPRFKAQGGVEHSLLAVRQKVIFPRDLSALRAVCEGEDVGLVIIDPLISVMGGANANDEAAIYGAIGPLNELSDKLDTAVIGVRHIGKNAEYDALESVLGSVAWVNIPRAVLNVAQTEDYVTGSVSRTVTLSVLASNRVRAKDSFYFSLVEENVPGVRKPAPKVVPLR